MYRRAVRATIITGPWPAPAKVAVASERRKAVPAPEAAAQRAGLTAAQLTTLEALEIFQWRLVFVRRPLFQAPIPVLFDRGETRHVVIEEDGTLNEQPTLQLRS